MTPILLGLGIWWGCHQDCPMSPSPPGSHSMGEPRHPEDDRPHGRERHEPGRVTLGNGLPGFLLPASPVSRSVARTTMTDVPMPAVSRSSRRLYCCCVNTGASSLTSSTYTITCTSRARDERSGGGVGQAQGCAHPSLPAWSLLSWASCELPTEGLGLSGRSPCSPTLHSTWRVAGA